MGETTMISVITATIRPEGLDLVYKALKRQTFTDFEWIIVAPSSIHTQITATIGKRQPFLTHLVPDPNKNDGDVWTMNKAMNTAIKHSEGDLIVSWQDYTYAMSDTLERFYVHFLQEPNVLITAVGNKYTDDTWTSMVWKDPRQRSDQGTYYGCYFNDIEWNLCSCPRKALYSIGGFDEYLDKYFGMDGYSVNERTNLVGGFDFKIDQTIQSYSLEHGRPNKWEENNAIHGPYDERKKAYVENPVLNYLS